MRILMVSPHLPAFPGTGSPARVYCLLRETSRRHEVHLVTGDLYSGEASPVGLDAVCSSYTVAAPSPVRLGRLRRLSRALSLQPDFVQMLQARGTALRAAIAQALDRFRPDVVQVVHSVTVPLLSGLPVRRPVVVDAHDLMHRLYEQDEDPRRPPGERLARRWQECKIRSFETSLFRGPHYVVAMTEEDRARVLALAPRARVAVVPNGVDTDYFQITSPGPPQHILFTGNLASRPNQDAVSWFLEAVMPRLRQARPDVRFEVVGASPPDFVREACDRHQVTLHASVADVRPHLADAGICVVPLRQGSGSRLKVLEAMAAGRAVVSTRLGAEGLGLRDREHLLLADRADDFAERVIELMHDEQLRQRLSRQGRRLVEEQYDWRVLAPRLDRVYDEIVASRV